jgi:hypothetical protein
VHGIRYSFEGEIDKVANKDPYMLSGILTAHNLFLGRQTISKKSFCASPTSNKVFVALAQSGEAPLKVD